MADKHYREPIKHTCPDIDKVLRSIDKVKKMCRVSGRESEDELLSIIGDIEHELWDADDQLEKLRRSNDELRSWGITEAEEVDALNEYIQELSISTS